jgi:hypothetical protein
VLSLVSTSAKTRWYLYEFSEGVSGSLLKLGARIGQEAEGALFQLKGKIPRASIYNLVTTWKSMSQNIRI